MPDTRFVYHANAAGVGGRFTRIDQPNRPANLPAPEADNVDYIIPVQGASSLPVFGGLSESRVGPYSFHIERPCRGTLMSVDSVYTRAISGHPGRRPFRAEAESRVSNVQFIERLTLRHAVARMTAIHDGENEDGPELRPECCELEGLLLDGYPIRVELNTAPFCDHPTFGHLLKNVKGFIGEFGHHLHLRSRERLEQEDARKDRGDHKPDHVIVGSIVSKILLGRNPPDGVTLTPYNSIKWKGVGEIFLGELLMSRTARRLTMLRVQFGSDRFGSGGGGEVEGNSGPVQSQPK